MSILITLQNPLNGQRQVVPSTNLSLSITSTAALNPDTLNIALNGTRVVEKGYTATPTGLIDGYVVSLDGYSSSIDLKDPSQFVLREKVKVLNPYGYSFNTEIVTTSGSSLKLKDAINTNELLSADGYLNSIITSRSVTITNAQYFTPALIGYDPWIYLTNSSGTIVQQARVVYGSGNQIFFDRDLSLNIGDLIYNYPQIQSITRDFDSTITYTLLDTNIAVLIDPMEDLGINKTNFLTVEVKDINDLYKREVFSFRTLDTRPPEIFNLAPLIENSEISFQIIDIMQSPVSASSLDIFIDGTKVVSSGIVSSNYSGSLAQVSSSRIDTYLRPHSRFKNNQKVKLVISTSDGYGNAVFYSKDLVNKTKPLVFELTKVTPTEESVLDPTSHPLEFFLKVNDSLEKRMINISYQINEVTYSEIINGEIVSICATCETQQTTTGTVRLSSNDLYIKLDNIQGVAYNSKIEVILFFQEVNEEGEHIGQPFLVRPLHYPTLSSTLGPQIDNFKPTSTEVASPTTKISYRLLSLTDSSPIDQTKIITSLNGILAIESGQFVNGFFGTIVTTQGSAGNSVEVILESQTPYTIGEVILAKVEAQDVSANYSTTTFTFTILNTAIPVVTFTPSAGVYNKIVRVGIQSNQPSQIYFTTNGTVPELGKIGTSVRPSPANDIPIFLEGITQIKAFAVSQSGVRSLTTTAIYDLNTQIPEILISSPSNNYVQDFSTIPVNYKVILARGYLVKVEVSLNGGFRLDTQNTLSESTALITGLKSGTNVIRIYATDSYNNTGVSEVRVLVNPSALRDFDLKFAPLHCPVFTVKAIKTTQNTNNLIDTRTVVIIGYGKREETLVSFAVGKGTDGQPIDFNAANKPDGRYFELASFPVKENSLSVFLFRKGREILVDPKEYKFQSYSGQLALDHPLETQESLRVEYISESDLESPELFLPSQIDKLYKKHGTPSVSNPLSLAAQMAFENGATRILAIQPKSFIEDSNWGQTFIRLEKEEGYLLVPVLADQDLQYYPSIRLAALDHCLKMSQTKYRKEKVTIASRLGSETNTFDSARLNLINVDQSLTARRIVAGESSILNYTFIAAALAGKESSLSPISTPLTKKSITGFTLSSKSKSPRLDLDQLIQEGFTPITANNAGADIYQARTSSLSTSPILQEPSVQRSVDYISKNLRHTLENVYTGRNIDNNLLLTIKRSATDFLSTQTDLITNATVVFVKQSSEDPRQVNIEISYSPLFPLNSLLISFTVSTTL